jgi:hypothetical protein
MSVAVNWQQVAPFYNKTFSLTKIQINVCRIKHTCLLKKRTCSYMFRLILSPPEALQDCIQRKCTHICVILLNVYRPQFCRHYYIRNLQIRQLFIETSINYDGLSPLFCYQ